MKIYKIYNNNVVSCLNASGDEMIITGAGVGFRKKVGDSVDEKIITQRFILEDDKRKKINQLIKRVPTEFFQLSNYILQTAKKELGIKVTMSIFMSFTDHITAAIQRAKQGLVLPNLMLMEIKTIWKKEYDLAKWSIDYIKDNTGIELPVDEIGYIALYFTQENQAGKENRSMEILSYVTDIIKFIEADFKINLDHESLGYMRLVTHLRFFIGRVTNREEYQDINPINDSIHKLLIKNNPELSKCEEHVSAFIKREFNRNVSKAEIVYLMIHITQILGKM